MSPQLDFETRQAKVEKTLIILLNREANKQNKEQSANLLPSLLFLLAN